MQRLFDILFAGAALLLLLPLLLPIAIVLRLSGEGEIFFAQRRIGRGGQTFDLLKFATMLKNSPNMTTGTVTVRGDPRILPVGRFLRSTKINELPQLLNVLRGDMSLIGPRPLTAQTFGAYSPETQAVVTQVRPGLSGIGSVIFRGEEDILADANSSVAFYNEMIAPYKGALERWYVAHSNLYTYFALIFATVGVVVLPKSQLGWRLFPDLPVPPDQLKPLLNYPG
ncbi:sugar transferase [Sphingoaurantiacus capsulatus]|uniref:Sugar transferase n=1 Tax=Sphingoaurantiacus capsulatus TaxID=1771310 RepID=A0ABV7X8H1_9SPHN